MRRAILVILAMIALLSSCRKKEEAAAPAAAPPPAAVATTATSSTPPASDAEDLVGLAQGALIAIPAGALETDHGSFRLIDDDPRVGWGSEDAKTTGAPTATVIALPERSSIDRVEFDTASAGLDTHVAKDVLVEMSDTSTTDGFKPIAKVTLVAMKDGQYFPADGSVAGRWVRLTVQSNYGSDSMTELHEFRAYGKKLTQTPMPNVSGAYETSEWGTLRLTQTGSQVSGCYADALTPLSGGIEGRVVRFTIDRESEKGPAILVFAPDGKTFFGGYWKMNGVEEHPPLHNFDGKKIADDPGACPGAKTPAQQMAKTLEDEKRLRLYGINFDSDSDHIRDESKPTLDLVTEVLKDHAEWKMAIEGHTDSTSTPEHNQQLSTARANAVKTYLTTAGIDGGRLTPQGLGSTKPVAPNDTALGRAANRRVELALQ